METQNDIIRRLNELALQAGRKRLSEQTGYIHHAYHASDKEVHYPIPIVENILYVLALLGSKSTENMLEARTRLERLLYFQSANDPFNNGNFPIYLHDYPACRDAFTGAHLLPPFYWILKLYGTILGSDLRERLEKSARLLLDHSLMVLEQKKVPDFIGMKISAAAQALGKLLGEQKLKEIGEEGMKRYHQRSFSPSWFSPASLAEICTALQMVHPTLSDSAWGHLWSHLSATWHFASSSYGGPGYKEFQEGYEPQVTLYDLYLGYFTKQFSPRSLVDNPCHLQAVLIQPSSDLLAPPAYPFSETKCNEWLRWSQDSSPFYSASFIQKMEAPLSMDKEFHPFKIIWGKEAARTFVNQGTGAAQMDCIKTGDGFELTFDFNAPFSAEERDKSREIAFYFDYDETTRITVDSIPATTFQVGQNVEWTLDGLEFLMKASVIEGEGRFFGHVMRGNRPSQTAIKGNQRFNSYDWTVFLRTLSRTDKCRIKIHLSIKHES